MTSGRKRDYIESEEEYTLEPLEILKSAVFDADNKGDGLGNPDPAGRRNEDGTPMFDDKGLATLTQLSRHANALFKPILNLRGLTKLPHLVAFGKKDEVEAMIKVNPHLLTLEGHTKDQAGRTLKGTALRLALGAKDVSIGVHEEMVEMIERYMREKLADGEEEIKKQIAAQFPVGFEEIENARKKADSDALDKVFKAIGASTTVKQGEAAVAEFKAHLAKQKERVIETGYHFNDELFAKAQDLYNAHVEQFGNPDSRKSKLAATQVIGGIQCYFTHCLAQAAVYGFERVANSNRTFRPRTFRRNDLLTHPEGCRFFHARLGVDRFIYSYHGATFAAGTSRIPILHRNAFLTIRTRVEEKLRTWEGNKTRVEQATIARR